MTSRKSIERAPAPPLQEGTPTWDRASFADPDIHRQDVTFGTSMLQRRYIQYAAPNAQLTRVRDHLMGEGLVLGRQVPANGSDMSCYIIPASARPIVHDTGVRENGPSVYDDKKLFSDLGKILKRVAAFDASGYEFMSPVGEHIAFINYTRPDDLKLALVPGFEYALHPTGDGQEAILNRYAIRLSAEFGERFIPNFNEFHEGFEG